MKTDWGARAHWWERSFRAQLSDNLDALFDGRKLLLGGL